jgi:hypothetical protein
VDRAAEKAAEKGRSIELVGSSLARANGTYNLVTGETKGGRAVYQHSQNSKMRVQYSTMSSLWMLDEVGANAPFRIAAPHHQAAEFPFGGSWKHYQGTRYTPPVHDAQAVERERQQREQQQRERQEQQDLESALEASRQEEKMAAEQAAAATKAQAEAAARAKAEAGRLATQELVTELVREKFTMAEAEGAINAVGLNKEAARSHITIARQRELEAEAAAKTAAEAAAAAELALQQRRRAAEHVLPEELVLRRIQIVGKKGPCTVSLFKKAFLGMGSSKHLVTYDDGSTDKLLLRRHGNKGALFVLLDAAPASAHAPPPAPPAASGDKGGCAAAAELGSVDKFCAPTIEMGLPAEAAHGLADLMGITDNDVGRFLQDPRRAIAREFEKHGSAKDKYNFECAATGQACEKCAGKTLEELVEHPDAVTARLKDYHVLALRLYTTSSYTCVNNPLRTRERPHKFAATAHFISEAIKKLRAVAAQRPDAHTQMTFWRGMRNLKVSMQFMAQGGTEFACLSTSASPEIACKFADSECPLVFKFTSPNFMSRGADISWLSVFPDEKETLYPPLTYLRPVSMGNEDVGGKQMLVATVEPQFPS